MRHVFALLAVAVLAPAFAVAAPCDAALLADEVCDCGCGTVDPACGVDAKFNACERSHCGPGTVPWEHFPDSCMTSACGDGWNDADRGEVCDDGNAINAGGCAAMCTAVNPGYVCGARASGCMVTPDGGRMDAGVPMNPPDSGQPDAGPHDAGAVDAGSLGKEEPPQPRGCSVTGAGSALCALLAWSLLPLARGAASRRRARR